MRLIWLERYLAAAVALLALLLVVAFALIVVLFWQLHETRDDLDRVESSAALVSLQVQVFREQLDALEPEIAAGLDEAIAGLQSFQTATLEFSVEIDQSIDVDADVPIDFELVAPIHTTLPIDEELDTTIEVQGPLGLAVPVDVTVPVRIDVDVDTDVVVPVHETLPLKAAVPVKVTVPVRLDSGDTGLTAAADALLEVLMALRAALTGLAE